MGNIFRKQIRNFRKFNNLKIGINYRNNKRLNKRKSSLFLFGAGATENAWLPITNWYQQMYGYQFEIDTINGDMASKVFLMRWGANDLRNTSIYKSEFDEYKTKLAEKLLEAQNKEIIKVRTELNEIVDNF